MKRHRVRLALSLAVVLFFLMNTMGIFPVDFTQRLENFSYDLRLQWTMPGTVDRRIVIVDIDEKSLKEQGHWPWSRNKLARMVDLLFERYKIDVLGFDVVFAERDESSGIRSLDDFGRTHLKDDARFQAVFQQLRPQLDFDQAFADSLKNRRVALGYVFKYSESDIATAGALPAPVLSSGVREVAAVTAGGFTGNLPELQASAAAGGYFSASLVDEDGIFRRVALLEKYHGAFYESLSLAVARLKLRAPKVEPGYVEEGATYAAVEWLQLGDRRIPVDDDLAALIPYRGAQGSFPYVSATDVLQGRVAPEVLQGAIVLLGTTAPGLMDLRSTPVGRIYPGVEVHANLIAGMLDQNIRERPAYTLGAEFISLLLVGLLLTFALPALSPFWASIATGAVASAFIALNLYVWEGGQVLPIASVLFLVTLIFVWNMSYGFFVESRGKRQLAGLFGQYVPPELVDEMAEDPEAFTLEGESREMTVLFSDVRGFTTISEGLDPRQLTQLMNEFLTPMTHVIHARRGTIDKYMGDAIMAFWGAPLADPEHARHALQAAMEMTGRLESLQAQFQAKGWPPIRIGVGINTGMMTVGNMGSEFRMAYTVMGDAVNLGSRLEGLTKAYGVDIIVSEFSMAQVPDFVFRELDRVRVKGKDEPVVIYEPICPAEELSPDLAEELALYADALARYRTGAWEAAMTLLADLQKRYPARYLYRMYAERVEYFRENPPGTGWDGVFTFKTK